MNNQEKNRDSLVRTIEDLHRVIRKRNDEISTLRMECRDLARELAEAEAKPAPRPLAEAEAKPAPRPLAVGDRVRVVNAFGVFAVGDVGSVVYLWDGGAGVEFRRDGARGTCGIPAANVERIEDES